jgi:hypothetical protein
MSSTKTAKPARCLYRSGSAFSSSRIQNLCLAAGLLISARQRARAADWTPRLNASLNLNQCERSLLRALGAYELKPRLTHRAKRIFDDLSPWIDVITHNLESLILSLPIVRDEPRRANYHRVSLARKTIELPPVAALALATC